MRRTQQHLVGKQDAAKTESDFFTLSEEPLSQLNVDQVPKINENLKIRDKLD
jgi:hypothetical protein